MSQLVKTVAITGASRGIGLAIARYLVGEGHNVIVSARSEGLLDDFRAQHPRQVRTVAGDVTDSALSARIAQVAQTDFKRLDGLVINHGVLDPVGQIADADVEAWQRNFNTNLYSALHLLKATLPLLRASEGHVVITSSGAARYGTSSWGAYCCSKAALAMLGETLALEEKHLTVVSVRPGVVDTQMQADLRDHHFPKMDPENVKKFTTMREQGIMLKPEQPGNVMARLVLSAPKELSGKFVQWNAPEVADFQDK